MSKTNQIFSSVSENVIEHYFWALPSQVRLDRDDYVRRWLGRQIAVPSGILDLLGVSYHGKLVVVELKKNEITSAALAQVCRYRQDIEQALTKAQNPSEQKNVPPIMAVYVGGEAPSSSVSFEASALNVLCFEYLIDIQLIGPYNDRIKSAQKQYEKLGQDIYKLLEDVL